MSISKSRQLFIHDFIPLASLNNCTLKISTTGTRNKSMQSHHEQETQEFILGKPKLGKNLATLSLEEVQQVQS
jgi:hypothetical protein